MKKLLFLTFFLILPITSKAYTEVEEAPIYEAYVNKKEGTDYITWSGEKIGTLKYNQKLKIIGEDTYNGKNYGEIELNDEWYMVLLDDLSLIDKKIDFIKYEKYEDNNQLFIFKKGMCLYAGPSILYGKTDDNIEIEEGTILTYEYLDDYWAYVNYNNHKGWIYINTSNPVYANITSYSAFSFTSDEEYVTAKRTKVYEYPFNNSKIVKTYSPLEKIEILYYYLTPNEDMYFYVNNIGWLKFEDTAYTPNYYGYTIDTAYTINDIFLYKDLDTKSNNINTKIEADNEIKILYRKNDNSVSEEAYYVRYKNKEGWVYIDLCEEECQTNILLKDKYTYKFNKTLTLYDKPNGTKTSKSIPAETDLIGIYYYPEKEDKIWIYISDNEYEGWVLENDEEQITTKKIDERSQEKSQDNIPKSEKEKNNSPSNIYIIIITALIIIIIILISLKKRKKA